MTRILDSSLIFSKDKIEDLFLEIDTSFEPSDATKDSLLDELVTKKVSALILKISQLPLKKTDDPWVIAALAPRQKNSISACFKKSPPLKGNALWIDPNTSVYADSNILMEQIRMWQPSVTQVSLQEAEVLFYHGENHILDREVLNIPPAELVPETSTGIWGVIVLKENLDLRRHLAQLHHKPTGIVNNVERKAFAQAKNGFTSLCVNCTKDKLGRFHLHAFTQNERGSEKYHLIQNSWIGLVDNFLLEIDKREG